MNKAENELRNNSDETDRIIGSETNMREDMQKVIEIPLSELHEFEGHPFRVLDDKDMEELVDSIKESGVIEPGIVRVRDLGGYEIVSGHRRKRACELAGLLTMPVFVKKLSDDDAVLEMVDANIHRESISHSEKAKAYQMRYNAMKGKNPGVNSLNLLAETTGENKKQIQRYVWLARLTDDLLRMVDDKRLPFIHGVNLSFLKEKEQNWVYDQLKEKKTAITAKQTELLKVMSQTRELTKDDVRIILDMVQPVKKKHSISFEDSVYKEFFDDGWTEEEVGRLLVELLAEWKKAKTNG